MDFDFTKILFICVLVTGLIWFLDLFLLRKKRDPEAPVPVYVEWGASFFPILAFVFVLRGFLFEPFQIPSGSMIPTLKVGDFIVVNKFSYGVRLPILGTKVIPLEEPQRGDVAVFIPPNDTRYFIKRVIGLPGDKIRIQDNQVWVNDEALPQEFIASVQHLGVPAQLYHETIGEISHEMQTLALANKSQNLDEVLVKDGHYFMMGDNRNNSRDSREWGQVPDSNLVGKAKFVWMHWKDWGVPSFSDARSIK